LAERERERTPHFPTQPRLAWSQHQDRIKAAQAAAQPLGSPGGFVNPVVYHHAIAGLKILLMEKPVDDL